MIKYWRKNKVAFLVHGLSNFDVIGKYVSACGDEIPLVLTFEKSGKLYWKKLFFQLSGAKLMFTVFLSQGPQIIHFYADHFELPDNPRSDVAVLLTHVNDSCQLRIFVAPAGSLSAYKDHDDLCKTLDERFTTCPRTEVGHGRDVISLIVEKSKHEICGSPRQSRQAADFQPCTLEAGQETSPRPSSWRATSGV